MTDRDISGTPPDPPGDILGRFRTVADPGGAFDVVTFGCRLNACESEAIARQGAAEGLTDAVVFNTCAVTGEAVRQARQAIRKAWRERPGARLIVTGCAAQIEPRTFAAMAEVDLIVGNAAKAAPGALGLAGPRVRVGDVFAAGGPGGAWGAGKGRVRAYVQIQNGCDHRCTFCIIPFGRGASRSVLPEKVIERVRALADDGFLEVVLTGVDLTSWGADLEGGPSLGRLVSRILEEVPALARLRLSSLDAAEIDPELKDVFAGEARLMPHLHLSLQSGDDLILKRMKRRHRRADALELVREIREVRPDAAFGADFIAGFPTESEAAFEGTLALVEEAGLAFVHVFPFSARPGVPASRMPPVPGTTVKARAQRLRRAGEAGLSRHLGGRVGERVRALVERPGLARAEDFTQVSFAGEAPIGRLIGGVIAGHDGRHARLDRWEACG
jgi:threonylcarbamoyladenosine tRNA methylthiotransferase MtaB